MASKVEVLLKALKDNFILDATQDTIKVLHIHWLTSIRKCLENLYSFVFVYEQLILITTGVTNIEKSLKIPFGHIRVVSYLRYTINY